MATLIKPDGTSSEISPANGHKFTLDELQALVSGYVVFIWLPLGVRMAVNEDGHPLGLPINQLATNVAAPVLRAGDFIVGSAVVLTKGEVQL